MMTKAAVFEKATEQLRVMDLEIRDPGPGEIMVRTRAVGVCGTDLFFRYGRFPAHSPSVLGHEASGEVVEVGAGVSKALVGTRVIVTDQGHCGKCANCLTGLMSYCTASKATTNSPFSANSVAVDQYLGVGALAELIVIPAINAIPLPDALSYEVGALLGCCCTVALATVANVVRPRLGDTAVVFGAGGVGLSAIRGLVISGCTDVIAVDEEPHRLAIAEQFGATDTIQATSESDTGARIRELLPNGANVSIEAVGTSATVSDAFEALAPSGRCVVIGMVDRADRLEVSAGDLRRGRSLAGTIMGQVATASQIPKFARLVELGRFDAEALVSDRWPLHNVNDAFSAARSRQGVRQMVTM